MMIGASELKSYKLPAKVKGFFPVDRFLSRVHFRTSTPISTGGNS
jgi:hypothetical protein